jgi:site-specific DNA-methyltransferase (adenine-specific)
MKPKELYEWVLENYAKKGDKILDTHLVSGSSAIASFRLGFDFVGIEIDKEYYQSSIKRFKEQTAQLRVF